MYRAVDELQGFVSLFSGGSTEKEMCVGTAASFWCRKVGRITVTCRHMSLATYVRVAFGFEAT